MIPTCQECGQPNAWVLIDTKYERICGACCDKPNVGMHPEGYYVRFAYCACGARGPVNFSPNIHWCTNHPHKGTL